MFDDPKKALRRMEEALRAAEYEQAQPEYEPDFDEDEESLLRSARELAGEEPSFHRGLYLDTEAGEDSGVYLDKPKRKKGSGKLLLAAIIELLLIWGVLLWWTKWR